MYSPWILGFGLALVALLVVRRFLSRRSEKREGIFRAQLRTAETANGARNDQVIEKASVESARPVSAAVTSGTPVSRVSTWQNRRLLADFRGIVDDEVQTLVAPLPEELPIRDEDLVFGGITPAVAQLLPESAARREVQRKLLLGAGYRSRASWINLTAIRFVLAFFSLVSIGFWLLMAPPQFELTLAGMAVVVPLLMWALPPLVVGMKANERKIDIERGLPDVLDMLNMGVSQGLSVPQCFRRIAVELKEAHPELADELRFVTQQADIGTMSQALKNFSQRIDSPEVSSFTSLLIQSESTGSSISRALTDYSDSIRSSLKERADSRANAASFKLLFPVALCLMPSVFLFLLGPAIVQLSDFLSNGAQALNNDRQNAMDSLQQQPRLDLSRFSQNGF